MRHLKYFLLIAISFICISVLSDSYLLIPTYSYGQWGLYALKLLACYSIFSFFLFIGGDNAFRSLTVRFKSLLMNKCS